MSDKIATTLAISSLSVFNQEISEIIIPAQSSSILNYRLYDNAEYFLSVHDVITILGAIGVVFTLVAMYYKHKDRKHTKREKTEEKQRLSDEN